MQKSIDKKATTYYIQHGALLKGSTGKKNFTFKLKIHRIDHILSFLAKKTITGGLFIVKGTVPLFFSL